MDSERWQRVAHLYESVLEREPPQRARFLAEATAGDETLRREVESLLEHDSIPVLIDKPMLATAAAVLEDHPDLEPGALLGPYRIENVLGAGGMGHVYRAIDTRLNRTVAVKVLPKTLASDPRFRMRFDREAHAIAALTHPHICTLHDIGQDAGVDFLVMEYLEGETLAARLTKGPLSIKEALTIAMDMADALAVAHGRGIIHRDLKPGNIMLTRSGPKLLDFGLAKPLTSPIHGSRSLLTIATPTILTAEGSIVGTLQYMAPEQLEGKDADARTDIFAFGAVVHEMLTGKKAFEGKSQAGLIGAIMRAEPEPISATQPLAPPALDRIVKNCVAKDPDDRWQSARDLSTQLQWIDHDLGTAVVVKKPDRRLAWAVATLLGTALVVVGIRQASRPQSNLPVARFTVAAPAGTSFLPATGQPWSPSISPDGSRIVFQVERDGERMLALRAIGDGLESHIIPRTERARFPFWSPDSRVIAFFAEGKLKKINVEGGSLQTICNVAFGLGGTWNQEGRIVFSSAEGLYEVPAASGTPKQLISARDGEGFHFRPQFLPDGQRFLYSARPDAVYLASIAGGAPRRVLTGTSIAVYARPGYLLFYRDRMLVAQRFDARLTGPTGDPEPIAHEFAYDMTLLSGGGAPFSVSDNGVLAYKTFPVSNRSLQWFDRTGRVVSTIQPLPFQDFGVPELSPDGSQIAVSSSTDPDEDTHIWLFDLTQRQPRQLTFTAGADGRPMWSPDGRRLLFMSKRRQGASGLYQKSVGDEPEELLLRSEADGWPTDWSSKGIVYESSSERFEVDLWILPIDGDRKPYPVIREPGVQGDAKVSPNGRWLAYTDGDSRGRPEVFVRDLATGGKRRISIAGGKFARWRDDGRELFYLAADGNLIAVPVEANATSFHHGVPETLFQTRLSFLSGPGVGSFGVSPGGRQFLLKVADDSAASIVVITNWPAKLTR